MNWSNYGYLRVAACAPVLHLGDPDANATEIIKQLQVLEADAVSIALFPELCLTGYTCEDLFFSNALHQEVLTALERIAVATPKLVAVIGLPWRSHDGRQLNVAAVLAKGKLLGLVPKSAHPNYGEFYERRWFSSADDLNEIIDLPAFGPVRIGRQQLFAIGGVRFAVEICEDLWAPDNPGAAHSLAGAQLTLNLSASNELVAKAAYRRDLVRMASAQRLCGYLYASSGPMESTKDLVFGGHCIAAEYGQLLEESPRFSMDGTGIVTEFDLDRLNHERSQNTSFGNAPRPSPYAITDTGLRTPALSTLNRQYPAHPFVPDDADELQDHAQEILNIQATGLARRMLSSHSERLVLGLSGGLDSTLALLVCLETLQLLKRSTKQLSALTLPGPGTSERTLGSARELARTAKIQLTEISIHNAVAGHLKDLNHNGDHDNVFENAQARERTQLLFNHANQVDGLVVGTGDLSELALGWCTYNADQMASYNVNASIPKTLVSYLVQWYAANRAAKGLAAVLQTVLDTPISPELLPHDKGRIAQETEAIIGPYELHDFFLFHWLRSGFAPDKIYHLAAVAFKGQYTKTELKRWLKEFFKRFFSQQFKRSTLPPGPKVGSVSLSPRGDWRMPDEASSAALLARIEAL